ncbi:MAG TPA: hypothetical protein VKT32_17000 [Chthonomonadaceae bacterium]|nr:hypothetical protein [Chthonomonadaceae bacterium]
MKRAHRITTLTLAAAIGASVLFAPVAARADANSDRNAAIGLGALAAGLLLTQKNKLPGLLAAGGALYEYSRYQRDRQNCYPNGDRYGYYGDNGYSGYNDNGYGRDNWSRDHRDNNGNRQDNHDRWGGQYSGHQDRGR